MKITIDTDKKTIELHGDVNVIELEGIIRKFNLSDYIIRQPESISVPLGTLNREFETVITPYRNVGPKHDEYFKNIPIGREFIYSDNAPTCTTNNSNFLKKEVKKEGKKVLLKG